VHRQTRDDCNFAHVVAILIEERSEPSRTIGRACQGAVDPVEREGDNKEDERPVWMLRHQRYHNSTENNL